MKRIFSFSYFLLLLIGILFIDCEKEETTSPEEMSWVTIFEDNFDGDSLDTDNWAQLEDDPLPYFLTGDGELEIDGDYYAEGDGATFAFNTDIPGSNVKFIFKFRTTQNDPHDEDVDIVIALNADITSDSYYGLLLSSDPVENTRDYFLNIHKIIGDTDTVLEGEYIGGTTPQIAADNDYILEGSNYNGTITFTIKDGSGNVLKSISVEDSSLSGGKVAFNVDLNVSTTVPQSIFIDYVIIQKYQ